MSATSSTGRVSGLALRSLPCLALTAGLLGCAPRPAPCDFEIVFDSTRDGSTELYTLDLDTLAVRQVTATPDPGVANRFPDFSPDGRRIVFVSENERGVGDLFLVGADGSSLRQLTHEPARYENPAWAPRGDWIAFEKGGEEDWGLYLIRPDGTGLRRLQGGNSFHPSWSPNGDRLAVVSGDQEEWFGAIRRLDSPEPRRVTPAGLSVGSVKWSPDGTRIAFDARAGGNFDLYLTGEDGSGLERLTESAAIDARPEWSPDGSRLVFHSTRDFRSQDGDGGWDEFELYLLDLDSRRVTRLTDNRVFDAHPDWCRE